jgi:hypothetical protein
LTADIHAVDVGQPEVQQDDIGAGGELQSPLAAVGHLDVALVPAQAVTD